MDSNGGVNEKMLAILKIWQAYHIELGFESFGNSKLPDSRISIEEDDTRWR